MKHSLAIGTDRCNRNGTDQDPIGMLKPPGSLEVRDGVRRAKEQLALVALEVRIFGSNDERPLRLLVAHAQRTLAQVHGQRAIDNGLVNAAVQQGKRRTLRR